MDLHLDGLSMQGFVCEDVGAALAAVEQYQQIRAHRRAGSALFREARASMLLRDYFEPVHITRAGPQRSMRLVSVGLKACFDWNGSTATGTLLAIGLRTLELAAGCLPPVGAGLQIRVSQAGREFRFSGIVTQLAAAQAVVLLLPAAESPPSRRSVSGRAMRSRRDRSGMFS